MSLTRRSFFETTVLSAIASQVTSLDAATGMPTRKLGSTGETVSLLAFGCGSRWLAYKEEEKALEAMQRGVDQGITYLDTAYGYGNGLSEERVGKFLKARGGKKGLFVATKIDAREGDKAMRIIEGSMKRLGLDQVDLMHMHSLSTEEDLALAEKPGNLIDLLHKMRDQKVARFIGVTCHTNPAVLKTALERHDFNCTQMALNIARMGNAEPSNVPGLGMTGPKGFESIALPVALRKKMGVIAMKVFAQEKLLGKAPIETLLRFSMSLPVSAVVAGMPQLSHIDENIQVAKAFKPFSRDEMEQLSLDAANRFKASIDHHFADHADC